MSRLRAFLSRLLRALREDDLPGAAAQMTTWAMLGLFPFLILAVGLLDLLPLEDAARALEHAVDRVVRPLSPASADLLQGFVEGLDERRPPRGLLWWLLPALWASARAMRGARRALDRILHGRETRPWLLRRFQDLLLAVLAVFLLGAADLLVVGGLELARFLAAAAGLDPEAYGLWTALRWSLSLLFLFTAVLLVYRFLPSRRLPWRALALGAVPAVGGWILLGLGFRAWLARLGRFDQLYGGLASFFVLMTLVWSLSLVLLAGGAVAAAAEGLSRPSPEPDPGTAG